VLRQVFPEVTRAVSQAGPGTHRLSITLNPESLGEVRVTLVVRAGAVRVDLAAQSEHARHALLQGAPDLQRLLDATGDARVVVRDGGSSPGGGASTGSGGSTGSTPGGGLNPQGFSASAGGSGRDPGRPGGWSAAGSAGTDAQSPATDPARPADPFGAGARPARTTVHPGRLDRLM
jgi:flagellar hook-length control protein FliK